MHQRAPGSSFGARLESLRETVGFTQEELAARASDDPTF